MDAVCGTDQKGSVLMAIEDLDMQSREALMRANELLGRSKMFFIMGVSQQGVLEMVTCDEESDTLKYIGMLTYIEEVCRHEVVQLTEALKS